MPADNVRALSYIVSSLSSIKKKIFINTDFQTEPSLRQTLPFGVLSTVALLIQVMQKYVVNMQILYTNIQMSNSLH